MALRLTTTPLATDQRARRPDRPRRGVHALVARASACLAAGDVTTYQDLLRQAAEQTSRTAAIRRRWRWWSRASVPGTGRGPGSRRGSSARSPSRRSTCSSVRPASRCSSTTPASRSTSCGASTPRKRCSGGAAARPALPTLRAQPREVRRRRAPRGHAEARRCPGAPRARPAAPGARLARRPASDLTLSLCMIVRDEEEMLPRCLAAVAPAVDEIIIVDTGSQDRTIEIARSFGARVIERAWTGSFAEARNVSFDAATGDWMMYLDADEVLVARRRRAAACADRSHLARGVLSRRDELHRRPGATAPRSPTTRCACSATVPSTASRAGCTSRSATRCRLPARADRADRRARRALRLPRRRPRRQGEVAAQHRAAARPAGREPADAVPALQPRLGVRGGRRRAAALAEFERAWQMVEAAGTVTSHEFTPSLIARLVKSAADLRAAGGGDRARPRRPRAVPGLHRPRLRAGGRGRRSAGEATRSYTSAVSSSATPRPLHRDGRLRHLPATDRSGRAAPTPRRARRGPRAARLVPDPPPGFFGTVAAVRERATRRAQSRPKWLRRSRRRCRRAHRRALRARRARSFGAAPASLRERQYRLVLARSPTTRRPAWRWRGAARPRRYAEAAAEAAALDPADRSPRWPSAGALRSDRRQTRDGRRRGPRRARGAAGLERSCSTAGPRSRGARPHGRACPAAGCRCWARSSSCCSGAGDVAGFDRLLPSLQSELAEREKRELLADMYLAHGFLAPAAKEWMAVCAARPMRALSSASRGSRWRRGMRRDASPSRPVRWNSIRD